MLYERWWLPATLSLVLFVMVACNSNGDSATTEQSAEQSEVQRSNDDKKKSNLKVPVTDTRFRMDSTLSGKNVVLILNRADVPIAEMTDFYLKIEGVDPDDVSISTNTKQGLVSKNKEKFYFGVKGVEGAKEIELEILVLNESSDRSSLGKIVLPTELKK